MRPSSPSARPGPRPPSGKHPRAGRLVAAILRLYHAAATSGYTQAISRRSHERMRQHAAVVRTVGAAAPTADEGETMARWRWVVLVFVCLVALGSSPALILAAPGDAQDEQETDVRACDGTPAPGYARCHARVRTDAKVRGKAPAPAASVVASPNVLGNNGAYDPGFLQAAYNLAGPAAGAGAGRTVAIVDAFDSPTAEADLGTYRSTFGLPPCTTANGCFRKVDQRGGTAYPAPDAGWAQEIALDVDMVSAICPRCAILLVEANSASFDDLAAAVDYAAGVPGVVAISNSYGAGEWSGTGYYDAHYTHPGIAITASTGDSGYGVQYPAAAAYVTAVGGTTLNQASNTGGRNATETVWGGAGSGCSAQTAKPARQTDKGCAMRTAADVAAVADPATGVWVYNQGGWYVLGGTSAASPLVAAVYALAGTNPGQQPAALPYAQPAALFDIVAGRNGVCGTATYLCMGTSGYDGPTGFGSPNGVAAFRAGAATADFAVAAAPATATVRRGQGSAAYTLTLTAQNGYAAPVQLAVAGLPAGTTATFSTNPVTPTTAGAATTLRVVAGRSAPRGGPYTLTITATGQDGTKHTTTVNLTIQ